MPSAGYGTLNSNPFALSGPEVTEGHLEGREKGDPLSEQAAHAGMAEMSEKYREGGNELYLEAGGRELD